MVRKEGVLGIKLWTLAETLSNGGRGGARPKRNAWAGGFFNVPPRARRNGGAAHHHAQGGALADVGLESLGGPAPARDSDAAAAVSDFDGPWQTPSP